MENSDDNQSKMIDKILDVLPQTQCTQCGFDNCRAYASAIAENGTPINRCPTGGQSGIRKLAEMLHCDPLPSDMAFGSEKPYSVAIIDESTCTGCTLCIQACPVDAIIGTGKMMHTVISNYCTGCELCIPTCPVDCISLKNISGTKLFSEIWDKRHADDARTRFERRQARLKEEKTRLDHLGANILSGQTSPPEGNDKKSEMIRKALERAKARAKEYRLKS